MTRFDVHTTSDTPASPGADLGPKRNDELGRDRPVREVVGSLLWLSTKTQPDIAYAMRAVARYAHTRTERLWQPIIIKMLYLNGIKRFGITYVRGSGLGLEVYASADDSDKANDGHSVSGTALTLGGILLVGFYLLTFFSRFPKKEHKFWFDKNRTHDIRY